MKIRTVLALRHGAGLAAAPQRVVGAWVERP